MNEWTNSGSQFLAPGINPGWHEQKKNLLKGCRVVLRVNIKTKIIQPHKWAATKGSQPAEPWRGCSPGVLAKDTALTPLPPDTRVFLAPTPGCELRPAGLQWRCPLCESDLADLWPEFTPSSFKSQTGKNAWLSGRLPEKERVWIFVPRQQRGPCCHLFENFSLNKTVMWCWAA